MNVLEYSRKLIELTNTKSIEEEHKIAMYFNKFIGMGMPAKAAFLMTCAKFDLK